MIAPVVTQILSETGGSVLLPNVANRLLQGYKASRTRRCNQQEEMCFRERYVYESLSVSVQGKHMQGALEEQDYSKKTLEKSAN
jgi:hypothetical protein